MSAPTVRERPTAYDFFTLDGERSPGIAIITSGGNRKEKIQDQQQPLTTGANTVVQGSENSVITYQLQLWEIGHLQTWRRWESMFLAGRKQRPNPRVYTIVDLNVSWLTKVIYEDMTPQKPEKPGGPWTRTLVLHEYNRVKPYGGPIVPGFLDKQLAAQGAVNAGLQKQLIGLQAASTAANAQRGNK